MITNYKFAVSDAIRTSCSLSRENFLRKVIFALLVTSVFFCGCDKNINQTLTVSFDSKGGSDVSAQTVKKGDKLQKPANPFSKNYIFLGWSSTDDISSSLWDFETDMVETDMTLYARWYVNKDKEKETTCNSKDVETPCNKSVCNDDLCLFYQQIWKELFLKETGFTEDYFSKHVFVCFTGKAIIIKPGSSYSSVFEIHYQVRVGWAMVSHTDNFVIQHGDEPYLTKEDIENERIPFNYHDELSNHEIFKFDSLESAITYINAQTQIDNWCVSFVHFASGGFFLSANARVNDRYFSAYLNLITGEINISEIMY